MFFKEFFKPSKFERLDIFKIVKRNSNKNITGIEEKKEKLLKTKNR